jgi:hypothetical protein
MAALSLRRLSREAGAFIAIGGRLMIDPEGNFLSAIGAQHLFERASEPHEAEACAIRRLVARRYDAAERGNERSLASIVAAKGKRTPNGWLVWEAN